MNRQLVCLVLLVAAALAVPGSSDKAQAEANVIRMAMLAPRDSPLVREFQKMDAKLRKDTNDAWGLRIYASGVAGDETDTIRKMGVGQLDSAVVTTPGMSQVVPAIAIMDAPGVINNYAELDAVQKQMAPEFEALFLQKNMKLLSWWETGQVRLFAKGSVASNAELRAHRPWVWPVSYVMKQFWTEVGVSGVPLGVTDVFGALQTGMIDMVTATPMVLSVMQWHRKLDHMTKQTAGILLMGWIINKPTWDKIPDNVKSLINNAIIDIAPRAKKMGRDEDQASLDKLLKMGYKVDAMNADEQKKYSELQARVVKKLTGKLWPESLVQRIAAITGPMRKGG